jgi:hypothetical protein
MKDGVRKILLWSIVCFVFSATGVFAAEVHLWKLQKDLEGIQVFTREVENSPILELRGEIEVDADIERTIRLYEQTERRTEWFHRSKEAKLLKSVSASEKHIYFAADLPWPLSDRDGIYRRVKAVDSVTQSVVYTLYAEVDTYPKRKDRVRVNYLDGEWRFTPRPGGRTAISYRMHTEAGGYIPAGVVNRFTVSLPFRTLLNFRRLLQKNQPSISPLESVKIQTVKDGQGL